MSFKKPRQPENYKKKVKLNQQPEQEKAYTDASNESFTDSTHSELDDLQEMVQDKVEQENLQKELLNGLYYVIMNVQRESNNQESRIDRDLHIIRNMQHSQKNKLARIDKLIRLYQKKNK
jgi:hypothetical protein